MSLNDRLIFLFSPAILFYIRIQMVMPPRLRSGKSSDNFIPLSTLLADTSWEMFSYCTPVLCTIFHDHLSHNFILLNCSVISVQPLYINRYIVAINFNKLLQIELLNNETNAMHAIRCKKRMRLISIQLLIILQHACIKFIVVRLFS